MYLPQPKYRYKSIMCLMAAVIVILLMPLVLVKGDLQGQYDNLDTSYDSETDKDKKEIIAVQMNMVERQMDVEESYSNMKTRVKALLKNDPRKDGAESELKNAEKSVNAFLALDVTKPDTNNKDKLEYVDEDNYTAKSTFTDAEKKAIKALNTVNQKLLVPKRPGAVPKGDILEDFVPGIIRILLRFASLAILVAFVVSGLMFVMAFGVEERLTKAKHMLYYSLIGFAVVTLAFAIVKAVTDIDFFGFI